MNSPKKIASQISRYYDDLENNKLELGPEMSADLHQERLYSDIMREIAQREKTKYSFRKLLAVACMTFAILGLSILGYYQLQPSKPSFEQVEMRTAVAAKGRIIKITLADGTEAWLNSGSTLRYPSVFSGKTREVSLQGEAYFQVSHDAKKPFLVHSEQLTTRVLGTSFNIRAYVKDKDIKVALLTGKVTVSYPETNENKVNSISIIPNQQVTYDKEKQSISLKKLKKAENLIVWREGRLHYEAVPLNTVIADLQRKYSVDISTSPELKKRKITADFHNESIKKVMIILSEMTQSKLIETEEGFFLK